MHTYDVICGIQEGLVDVIDAMCTSELLYEACDSVYVAILADDDKSKPSSACSFRWSVEFSLLRFTSFLTKLVLISDFSSLTDKVKLFWVGLPTNVLASLSRNQCYDVCFRQNFLNISVRTQLSRTSTLKCSVQKFGPIRPIRSKIKDFSRISPIKSCSAEY